MIADFILTQSSRLVPKAIVPKAILDFISEHPFWTSFLSGSIASLSLPPAYITPAFLLWGLVLYQAAIAPRWQLALWHITAGAYGWFTISLYWIGHALLIGEASYWYLLPVSVFGIPVLVTIFWSVAGVFGYVIVRRPAARLVMISLCLGLAEWGREFIATGFPWNAPGLVFLVSSPTAYLAAYFGQTGLNLLAFLAACYLPLWLLLGKRARASLGGGGLILLLLLGGLSYAHHKQSPLALTGDAARIRLIQPAVPQAEKWDYEKRPHHLAKMVALSVQDITSPADLVIWPEAAFAGNYSRKTELVEGVAGQVQQAHQAKGGLGQIMLGTLRTDADNQPLNSALFIASDGKASLYDKTHLVPFGEYVPLRAIPLIDAIAGPVDFQSGDEVRPFAVEKIGLVQPLICYEAIFPSLTGRATRRAALLVNVTNDAWFGRSAGPYQHLAQTQMTALSYGLPLIRVANTGISAVISAKGDITQKLALGTQGFLDVTTPHPLRPTFFAKAGALPIILGIIFSCLLVFALDRYRQKRQ